MLDEREEQCGRHLHRDTSGSMDRLKKYLARSFFFLLYQFLCTAPKRSRSSSSPTIPRPRKSPRRNSSIRANRGTLISSPPQGPGGDPGALPSRALEHLAAFHCSDGDNFESDNDEALKAARELGKDICALFGYGEITMGSHYYESSTLSASGGWMPRTSSRC
ncbi:MAG: DUF444 family protein [Geminicoccaceae bacterium]